MHLCFFHFITSRKLTSGLQISLSSPELLTFFRRIFRLCEFGHSGVLLLCSNICYSHWDQCTYASDLHLMTSRKLTSGFDFWSCSHLCMVVMYLAIQFGADIFIQSEVTDIFPKLKMAAAAILDLFGGAIGPPTKAHSWCLLPVKILSWSAK